MFTHVASRKFLDEFFGELENNHCSPASYQPSVSVFQKDESSYVLLAELPGVTKDSLKVEIKNRDLVLSGEKPAPEASHGFRYSEIRYGKFQRSFRLADSIDTDRLEAKFENGLLEVKLSLRPELGPKQVNIL